MERGLFEVHFTPGTLHMLQEAAAASRRQALRRPSRGSGRNRQRARSWPSLALLLLLLLLLLLRRHRACR